jgi:hypothetical protein
MLKLNTGFTSRQAQSLASEKSITYALLHRCNISWLGIWCTLILEYDLRDDSQSLELMSKKSLIFAERRCEALEFAQRIDAHNQALTT